MTDRQHCKEQIERFKSYPGYPDTTAGLKDLVDTLQRVCVTNGHVTATIQALLSDAEYCPKVRNIIEAANGLIDRNEESRRQSERCQRCGGTGYLISERQEIQAVRQADGTRVEQMVSVSDSVPCPRCRPTTKEEA